MSEKGASRVYVLHGRPWTEWSTPPTSLVRERDTLTSEFGHTRLLSMVWVGMHGRLSVMCSSFPAFSTTSRGFNSHRSVLIGGKLFKWYIYIHIHIPQETVAW